LEGFFVDAIKIIKSDGATTSFDSKRMNAELLAASAGLPDQTAKIIQIAADVQGMLFDGMSTRELDETIIQAAVQNIKDDPDYDRIAAQLLLRSMYRRLLGNFVTDDELRILHARQFPEYIKQAVKDGLLTAELTDGRFDLEQLAAALQPDNDRLFKYLGVVTNNNRYALRRGGNEPIELPQYTHMRVAMGLSLNAIDPTATAIDFYRHMSNLDYLPGGSTRINAGGTHPQMSNCFVIDVDDDMESIAKSVHDTMWISKGTGGIGLSFSKLRAAGSPVKTTNTESTGPIPFMKMIDTALFAVSRKGKKAGAAVLVLENWHLNFPQFLDLRQNSGDPYLRTRFANTAVYLSDEFMRRVEADEDWYLFDPAETMDLTELYGEKFATRYREYTALAEAGSLRKFEKLPAREQYRQILIQLQATSHPWLTWKDAINVRALNNNTGTIHSSNLCTEIALPNDRDNIAVCNLASINLSRHLTADGKWDWDHLASSVRSAITGLDNLIDVTTLPVPEAMHSNHQTRAVGLGIMGLADVLERLNISYESPAAADLIDEIMEFISYHAIETSADLATELGSYPGFDGSGWSQGILPIDTIDRLEKDRGSKIEINRDMHLDWSKLRQKVKKGMRNAALLAIAPTANIGHIAGTTPGIDPQFSQIFSRSTLNGKFLEVNVNLVNALKKLGRWEELHDELLINQGDIQNLDLPDDLKQVYKTSFQLSPNAFINVAARAQKWVDQAISRNMYLATRNIDDYEKIYLDAWRAGLKTTYYLHVLPRHQSEQTTVQADKSEAVRLADATKIGFGFAKKSKEEK
jgi:ribonucleoside-diphosphate reductase alpha chain